MKTVGTDPLKAKLCKNGSACIGERKGECGGEWEEMRIRMSQKVKNNRYLTMALRKKERLMGKGDMITNIGSRVF